MSVQRAYSQRNNNLTQIIPVFMERSPCSVPFGDLSGVSHYHVNIPNLQNVGGVYYVDLADVDSSGNPLDFTGTANDTANIINFGVDISVNATLYPGLEVTVFFKHPPSLNTLTRAPLFSIGLFSVDTATPTPYIVSPPVPWFTVPTVSQSLTFKSDGAKFNVVSSGPAGWYGLALYFVLLEIANNGPP
jgi:hypothetical protein